MADSKVTIEITGTSEKLVKAFKKGSQASKIAFKKMQKAALKSNSRIIRSFGKVSKKMTDGFGNASKLITANLGSIKKIGTIAFVALGAAVAASVKAFASFQNEMLGVKTLLDESSFGTKSLDEGFKKLQADTIALSKEVPFAMSSITKSLFDTVSAGIAAEDAITALGSASRLAVAGITDISIATDGITSALNAYGLEASSAESVAAKFFTAQKYGKTTVEELSNSFGLVGANAQAAGVGLEELLGAVSAVTAGGVKTNAAFTGLKAVLANVAKPSKEAALEAQRLGVEFNAASLRAKGLEGFLADLTDAQGFTEDSVTKLFGSVEAQSVAFALTGQQAKSFARNVKELGNEQKLASTFTKAFTEQNDSLENRTKKLFNGVKALAIQFGEKLQPAVNAVLSVFEDITNDSSFWETAIDGVAGAINKLAGSFLFLQTIAVTAGKAIGGTFGVLAGSISKALSGDFKGAFQSFKKGSMELSEDIENTFVSGMKKATKTFDNEVFKRLKIEKAAAKKSAKINEDKNKQILKQDEKLTRDQQRLKESNAEKAAQFEIAKGRLTNEERDNLRKEDSEKAQASLKSKIDIENEIASEALQEKVDERNRYAEDEVRAGKTVADANAFFRSEEVAQTEQVLGNLTALTNTKSKELFEIGKTAALAQAVINTAQGVTKALAQGGIFGPILAGSVTAAGLVQIATIKGQKFQGAADGGLMEGGIAGKDSIPTMTMPGELVVPRKSYDDVVNDAAARKTGNTGGSDVRVVIEPRKGAMELIETKIIKRQRNGTSRLSGAVA